MIHQIRLRLFLTAVSLALILIGCATTTTFWSEYTNTADKTVEIKTLTVFAAASLTEAFSLIADEFKRTHLDADISLNFAGSQALRLQIEQGAQADVFASANQEHAQALFEAHLIKTPIIFANNRLVIITPADNPGSLQSPADLAKPGLKLVLAGPTVPVGRYAREALEKFNHRPELGPDFSTRVLDNLVSEEENVKAVVAKIQLGEADAGIVYASDVTPTVADALDIIEIPPETNVTAAYPIALVSDSPQKALAQEFIDLVLSPRGQTILAEHGFKPVQSRPIGREP